MRFEALQRSKIARRLIGRPAWLLSKCLWRVLPARTHGWRAVRGLGRFIFTLSVMRSDSAVGQTTCFLRNRAELDEYVRLVEDHPPGGSFNLAVIGCSTGCEVFSILWRLRSARPDLEVEACATDISPSVIAAARDARYPIDAREIRGFEYGMPLSEAEVEAIFDRDGDMLRVKPSFRVGITWRVSDIGDRASVSSLGRFDLVVANNVLIRMSLPQAAACVRNLVSLVTPRGHLFVSGVNLDARTQVAQQLGLEPVADNMEKLHNGTLLRSAWPLFPYGLEPFDARRHDAKYRYCPLFRVPPPNHGRAT